MALHPDSIRRILIALIEQAQSDLQKKGLIRKDQAISPLVFGTSANEIDAFAVDEATLGFDSLSRLELISSVNRFFQLSQTGAEDYLPLNPSIGRWVETVSQHATLVGEGQTYGFATSGTAGPVTIHLHPLQRLEAEVDALRTGPLNGFACPSRIIALVPPHHIFGFLFTCLLPSMIGADVIDLHRHAPSAVARMGQPGDLVIGTPFSWQSVAATGMAISRGLHGITSGGPSTDETWLRQGPGRPEKMTEIYGATETGGIGSRQAQEAPFSLLEHLAAVDSDIVRAADADQAPLPIQDRIVWTADRQFRLGGRFDQVVQVAGVNVQPAQVAACIGEVTGVADVAVRPGNDRLKGFVVAKREVADLQALEVKIRDHVRMRLPAPARPGTLTFGAALPRNVMGKPCDWAEPKESRSDDVPYVAS